jgi:hypothetical protein
MAFFIKLARATTSFRGVYQMSDEKIVFGQNNLILSTTFHSSDCGIIAATNFFQRSFSVGLHRRWPRTFRRFSKYETGQSESNRTLKNDNGRPRTIPLSTLDAVCGGDCCK